MAPPSTSLSRLGQINKAGADDALFLKQFGGEILTEFNRANVFKERNFVRQISNGNLPEHLNRVRPTRLSIAHLRRADVRWLSVELPRSQDAN